MDINEYAEGVGFGQGSNKTKMNSNGEIQLEGEASAWDDIIGSITGLKLPTVVGKVDYDFEENAITFQSGGDISNANDRVIWNIQKPHKTKTNSELRYHIHYIQPDTVERTFRLQYRRQGNGETTETAWTTIDTVTTASNHVFTYTSGNFNQILKFPAINWSGDGISTVYQFRLTRIDADATPLKVWFVDGHYEIDSIGSGEEYIK